MGTAHPARIPCGKCGTLGRSFTVVELLVVIGMISVLMGIGAGVYFAFLGTVAVQAETRAAVAIVQSARSTARAQGCETFVCVDRESKQIYPFSRSEIGVWRFETVDQTLSPPPTYGAFGHAALVTEIGTGAAVKETDGHVGNALDFDGTFYLTCKKSAAGDQHIPSYDTHEGVELEAWIRPVQPAAAGSAERTVVHHDGWFGMSLEYVAASGRLKLKGFAVVLAEDEADYTEYKGSTTALLRPNEWTHVRMACHKLSGGVRLWINGALQKLETPVPLPDEGLGAPDAAVDTTLGAGKDGAGPFYGKIDQVVLSAYQMGMVHQVAKRLELDHNGVENVMTIRFDASGSLTTADGKQATVPSKIILREKKGTKILTDVTITVGVTGAVDVESTTD